MDGRTTGAVGGGGSGAWQVLGTPDSPDLNDQVWSVLEHLARSLHLKSAELQPTLEAIVASAVSIVAPARHAGVILLVKGRLEPQATVGTPPRVLDEFQQRLGTGPCHDAARQQSVIVVDDLGSDHRWPELTATATALGVGSMLCIPLHADDHRLGTLSLYAEAVAAFSANDLRMAELFATHAALALSDAQRIENLTIALHNRDLIGQAKGILVERLRITPSRAFEHLAEVSQTANLKLSAVAQHLVDTGELPAASHLH